MTLAQLFTDAVQYDEPRLAYTIYWASQNGLSVQSDFETLKAMDIDHSEVNKLIALNPLNIGNIKLYTCKEGNGFHLVLAESERDAKSAVMEEVGYIPNRMHDVSHGMDNVLWDNEKKKSVWIRGMKNDSLVFPVYIGWLEKE